MSADELQATDAVTRVTETVSALGPTSVGLFSLVVYTREKGADLRNYMGRSIRES